MTVLEWCNIHENNMLDEANIDISLKEHNSLEIVEWKCDKGHVYTKSIRERVKRNRGCPYCAGKKVSDEYNSLYKLRPDLADQWDYENNPTDINPHTVTPGSNKMAYWVCSKGHRWKAMISNRGLKNSGCPTCSNGSQTSMMEQLIYLYIKETFKDTINRCKINGFEYDIFIPELDLAVEYNGRYYHSNSFNDYDVEARDKNKIINANNAGIHLIIIKEEYTNNSPYKYGDNTIIFGADNLSNRRSTVLINIMELLNNIMYAMCKVKIHDCDESTIDRIMQESAKGSSCKSDADGDISTLKEYKGVVVRSAESLGDAYSELIDEWDKELNGGLTPFDIKPKSNNPVYWNCQKCGYRWKTSPAHRVMDGTGCPKCLALSGSGSGSHLLIEGINDLKTLRPDLFKQLHKEDNVGIDLDSLHIKSNTRVRWRCDICNGTWIAPVSRRSNSPNPKCPVCINRTLCKGINDLKTVNSRIAIEFDMVDNGIKSEDIIGFSNKYVNWKCSNCEEVWSSSVSDRTRDHKSCPYCGYRL